MRAAILKSAARNLHPHFAFGGLRVVGVRPDRSNWSALRAHIFVLHRAQEMLSLSRSLPIGGWVVVRVPGFGARYGAVVRRGRHSPHSLPARAISSCDPTGSYRSVSTARIQAPDLSETRPSGLPEAHRAEWRGQGTKACTTSPTGLSDAYTWCPLPEVARRSRPTPMPTARGPHNKETARSLHLRTLVAVDYVCACAERPPARHRSFEEYLDIDGWRHWGRAVSPTSPGQINQADASNCVFHR